MTTASSIKPDKIKTVILSTDALGIRSKNKTLLHQVNISIETGSLVTLIGPNGAGKTTLIKALSGEMNAYDGDIYFKEKHLSEYQIKPLSQQRAVLPQLNYIGFPLTVKQIISLGREPYYQSQHGQFDKAVIDLCLNKMELQSLAGRHYNQLSGGEQQRTQIARVLAQILTTTDEKTSVQDKLLLLDEPVNHLDIYHQQLFMQQLKALQKQGLSIFCSLHDLAMALKFSDYIYLVNAGHVSEKLTPDELIRSNKLQSAFGIDIKAYWQEDIQQFLLAPVL